MFEYLAIETLGQLGDLTDVFVDPVFWFGAVTGVAFTDGVRRVYETFLSSSARRRRADTTDNRDEGDT